MKNNLHLLSLLILLGITACGAMDAMDGAAEYDPGNNWDAAAAEDSASEWDVPLPEEELEFDYKAPQASEHYVYVASTARDSVVRIDAASLEIRLIPVGSRPTRVATLPVSDVALVINSGTHDLSIITSTAAADTVQTVDIVPYCNRIAVSPSGDHALVFYDEAAAESNDPVGDFQTLSLVSLQDGQATVKTISVGFHPTAVFFHEDQPLVYIVTDDGISVLDLSVAKDGTITPVVPVANDPLEDPALREVLVTEDGSYALVRSLEYASLRVVDLGSGDIYSVELAGIPTDVDLIPEQNQALLLLREQEQAVVVDLAQLWIDPTEALSAIDLQGTGVGAAAVSPLGDRAVLYTTTGTTMAIAVLDLTQDPLVWNSMAVQKHVKGVALSPFGTTALVFHESEGVASDASDLEETIAGTEGFTILDLDSGYRKLIQTKRRWSSHLFVSNDSEDLRLFVLTPDPLLVEHSVQVVDLSTFINSSVRLSSTPTSLVHVAVSGKVAISQDHPNGRISFVDAVTGEMYSVTGYELNGLIYQ